MGFALFFILIAAAGQAAGGSAGLWPIAGSQLSALIIGGLMAAAMTFGHRNGFLFALGGATAAWISGNALLLDRPRIYALFVGIAALMLVGSTLTLVL